MHKIIRRYLYITVSILLLCGICAPEKAEALGWPHENTSGCNNCHGGGFQAALYGFEPKCLECHQNGGDATLLPFSMNDAADPFGTFTSVTGDQEQISHSWGVSYTNTSAGAKKGSRFISQRATNLSCASCHYAHQSIHPKGLRIWTDASANSLQRNGLCIQCHSARDVTQASDNVAPKTNSHPVNIQLPDDAEHYNPPNIDAAYSSISSSVLKLFSTVGGGDTVHCKSCHGVHYTDSNPYTEDVAPKYPSFTGHSTGDGYLLRRYNDSQMCKDCHKYQDHGDMTCRNCHKPHNVEDNIDLIMRNISTPGVGGQAAQGNVSVFKLLSTSGFVTATRDGTGLCEVCHNLDNSSQAGLAFDTWSTDHFDRVGGMANAPANNCLSCHSHKIDTDAGVTKDSFKAGCSGCHQQPPVSLAGFAPGYTTSGGGVQGTDWFDESLTPHLKHAGGSFPNYPYNSQKTGSEDYAVDGQCRACHAQAELTHHHQESTGNGDGSDWQDVSFGLYTYGENDGRAYNTGTRQCTNVYCHSNSGVWNATMGAYSTPVYTPPTWGENRPAMTCSSCHAATPTTNKHTPHLAAEYNLVCASCHSATVDDVPSIISTAMHVNGTKDVIFGTLSGTDLSGGSMAAHVCSDVYCHGEFAGGDTNNDPTWSDVAAAACGTCHTTSVETGGTDHDTGADHDIHVGIYDFTCDRCHDTLMNGDLMDASKEGHIDGKKTVAFNSDASINNSSGSATAGPLPTCTNIYCHSPGHIDAAVGSYSTAFNKGAPAGPTWGSTKSCDFCHGNSTYTGSEMTKAMPNYASGSPKANSHKEHVIDNSIECKSCHYNTTRDNFSIYSTELHVNGDYDIRIPSAYDDGGASYDGLDGGNTRICSSVKCHGGNDSPAWGTSAVCRDCHYSTAGDVDDFAFSNFSGVAAKIYSSDWVAKGHGATAATCVNCHDGSVGHGAADNPFRIFTSDPDALCNNCHGPSGDSAYGRWTPALGNKTGIFKHASSVTATGRHDFDLKCIDCHDPHGDNNIFMIHSTVIRPGTGNPPVSNVYGVPTTGGGNTVMNVDFTASAVAGDYAQENTAAGICQVCHDKTYNKEVDTSELRFNHNTSIDKDHGDGKCTECHSHSSGFAGAGCWDCHGFAPITSTKMLGGADTLPVKDPTSYSVGIGAHKRHMDTIQNNFSDTYEFCDACHEGGMADNRIVAGNGNIDIRFNAFAQYSTGTYDGNAGTRGGFYGYSGDVTGGNARTCSAVKCHGGGGWLTGGAVDPVWTGSVVCGECHGAKKEAGAGTWPTSGKHLKHAGTGGGQYDIMCKTCHNATVLGTATTLDNTNHVNAKSQVEFAAGWANNAGLYANDTVNDANDDSCDRTYCHSRAHDTTVGNYSAPNQSLSWLGAGASCKSCHGSNSYTGYTAAMPNYANGSPKINSHKQHVVDNGIACYACHYDTTQDAYSIYSTSMHVNKSYDVKVPVNYDSGQNNSYAGNTCSSVDCHDNTNTNAWGGASYTCENCHLKTTDVDDFAFTAFSAIGMAKLKSAEWTTAGHGTVGAGALKSGNNGPNLVCNDCHDDGTSTKHNESGNYFRLDEANTNTLCLSCHGSGAALTGGAKIGNITGIQNHSYDNMTGGYKDGMDPWNFTPKCVDCHDPHGDKNRYMMHTYVSYSGSDGEGRPSKYDVLTNFSTVGGGLMNWSSYVNVSAGAGKGLCQRCHGERVDNFDKDGEFNQTHNNGQRCTDCHAHNKGFTPSGGCPDCHFDTADFDNFTVGGAQAKISQKQYTSVGHGKDGIALDCLHCHDETIEHPTLADQDEYFRLYTSDSNALCAGCHGDTGAATYQAWTSGVADVGGWVTATKTGIFTHSTSVMQTGRGHKVQLKCVDCHDPHGDDNIFMIHSTVSVPNDTDGTASDIQGRPVVANLENVDFTANNYTSDYAVKSAADKVCQRCHNATAGKFNNLSARFQFDGSEDSDHGTDKCTGCHSHANGFMGLACDDCHGMPPTDTPFTILSGTDNNSSEPASDVSGAGAHKAHTDVMGATGDICARCHNSGMWGSGAKNAQIDLEFKAFGLYTGNSQDYTGSASVNADASYTYAGNGIAYDGTQQCNNMKCHGATNSWLTGGSATAPDWFTPNTGECGDCHGVKKVTGSTSWPTTNAHAKHVTDTTYDFMCVLCHSDTIKTPFETHTTLVDANHVTGVANVNLYDAEAGGRLDSNSAYNGGGSDVNATFGTCDDTYCHSQGTDLAAPYTAAQDDPRLQATWSDSAVGCNYCHGSVAYGDWKDAMPNYADESPKNNSHVEHVVDNDISCMSCHEGTLSANNTIGNYALHINGAYNVDINSKHDGAGAATYSGGTCTNVKCHGSNSVDWGTPTVACSDCHYSTGDVDNFVWTNITSAAMTMAMISQKQYTSVGHGDFTITCAQCHKAAVDHGTASNPFRLHTSDSVAMCENCHTATSGAFEAWGASTATKDSMFTHATSVIQSGRGHKLDAKCIDCHDPHGDDNLFMIHSTINAPRDSDGRASDQYGTPLANLSSRNVDFTYDNTTGGYAYKVQADKICQVCHNATELPGSPGTKRYQYIGSDDATHGVGLCTDCHPHSVGFKGAGCGNCHGNAPTAVDQLLGGDATVLKQLSSFSITPGQHATHEAKINASGTALCQFCHKGGMADTATLGVLNTNIDIGFGGTYNKYTTGTYKGQAAVETGYYGYSGDDYSGSTEYECASVKCHGGNSWLTDSAASMEDPKWNDTTTAECGDCHGVKKAAGAGSWPTTNAHAKHVIWGANEYDFMCDTCHSSTILSNNTTLDDTVHITGIANVDLNDSEAGGRLDGASDYYGGGSDVNATFGRCEDTYCHSRGTDQTAPFVDSSQDYANYTAKWDASPGYNCNYCHGNDTYGGITSAMPEYASGSPKVNSHDKHAANITLRLDAITCQSCHNVTLAGNATIASKINHVDKDYDVDVAGGGSYDGSQCSTVYCHGQFTNGGPLGNGTADTPVWGTDNGTLTCDSCHRGNANDDIMPERHPKHAGDGAGNYNFDCQACHVWTASGSTAIINTYSSHVNNVVNVVFDGSGTIDNSNGTINGGRECGNIYCHSPGHIDKAAGNYSSGNIQADWDTSSIGCNYCHGGGYSGITSAMPYYPTGSPKENSHFAHVVSNGVMCNVCHSATTTDNTSISNVSVHVDGFYNISVGTAYKTANEAYDPAGLQKCSNITCHGGAASLTPAWGTAALCSDCHVTGAADNNQYGVANGTPATHNQTEWDERGHGQAGYGMGCKNCHAAGVAHSLASNPYRLYTSDPNALCFNCHGTGSILGSWTTALSNISGYVPHSKSETGGNANWSQFEGQSVKCVDCHDPHGDKNRKMIQLFVNFSGSDKYGSPAPDFSTVEPGAVAQINFTTVGGGLLNWSSYVIDDGSPTEGLCRRCHDTEVDNFDKGAGGFSTHNAGAGECTGCHKHTKGFKGAGESGGGSSCEGCHSALFDPMTSDNSYHHYMQNAAATYSNATSLTTTDTRRRCLMCHVDHNIFSPEAGGIGRAMNLLQTPRPLANVSGINTDFWPQNPKYNGYVTQVTGGSTGANGICIGCHNTVKLKNEANRGINDGSSKARGFSKYLYYSSSHNFQVIEAMSHYSSDEYSNSGGPTSFRANCSKCHGSYAFDKNVQAGARERFGLHDTKYQSLNRALNGDIAKPSPLGKNLCYNCHGTTQQGSYDYYSSVPMGSGAKGIQSAVENKTYGHPAGQFPGHDPSEYYDVTFGWLSSAGELRHIDCTDCHNTHGGNSGIVRDVGSPTGNGIAGAQKGVWGVNISSFPGTPGTSLTSGDYTKVDQITKQWQLCAKCHSSYAWGDDEGSSLPSQGYDLTNYTTNIVMTDVMREFNPNNDGFHPVVSEGKNQPPSSLWESGTTGPGATDADGIKWRDSYNNISGYANLSGLDWAMVPPFNTRSTLGCTDCHQADTTYKAVAGATMENYSVGTGTSWTNPANVGAVDAATAGAATDTLLLDVGNSTFSGAATHEVAVWASTGVNGADITYQVYSSGVATLDTGMLTITRNIGTNKQTAALTLGVSNADSINDYIKVAFYSDGSVINVDKLAIESTYTMGAALRGPHGSMMPWILTSANTQIEVDWDDSGTYDGGSEAPNDNIGAGTPSERTFCFNCHRRDVYVFETVSPIYTDKTNVGNYSRFKHFQVNNGGGPTTPDDGALANKWGIPCMTCHGGARAGAIHGDWADNTAWSGYDLTDDISRPLGVRLLNGAGAHMQVVVSATPSSPNPVGTLNCYTRKDANNTTNMGGCTTNHTPSTLVYSDAFNYDYTSY